MNLPMKVNLFKIPQNSPDDLTQLDALVQSGQLDPSQIVAILGKTEGNGCVNDFTRGFTTQTLKHYFSDRVSPAFARQVIYVMSGGTEGVLSPHLNVFTREAVTTPQQWGLALGTGRTRDFLPEEIGTLTMVDAVASAVQAALNEAAIDPADAHFVQIKCPLITANQLTGSGQTGSSYQSMALSRAASALGIAVALGEIDRSALTQSDIGKNYSLYSAVASTSAGIELRHCEVFVLGNSPQSASDLLVGHSVMQHALDVAAVQQAIQSTGATIDRVVNLFAKAEADPTGMILGRRHTMLDDSDINHTRMARAVVAAVLASVVQDPMVYVSGGAEHQGPPGGGPVAAIVRR